MSISPFLYDPADVIRKYSFDKPTETFAVVPDDFRMLGGDINRDFYDKTIPSHDAVSFQCIGPGYDSQYTVMIMSRSNLLTE